MNNDEESALLHRVADGKLHLACCVCAVTTPEERKWDYLNALSKTHKPRQNKLDCRLLLLSLRWRLWLHSEALMLACVTHMENAPLCLMSRWEGTHLGMTSPPLTSPPVSPGAPRHNASWVSKTYKNRNNGCFIIIFYLMSGFYKLTNWCTVNRASICDLLHFPKHVNQYVLEVLVGWFSNIWTEPS